MPEGQFFAQNDPTVTQETSETYFKRECTLEFLVEAWRTFSEVEKWSKELKKPLSPDHAQIIQASQSQLIAKDFLTLQPDFFMEVSARQKQTQIKARRRAASKVD